MHARHAHAISHNRPGEGARTFHEIAAGRSTEGETVYVACSSLCFGRYALADALYAISELHFHKVDLALHESGPHLKPSEVMADINHAAQVLRKANVVYAAFHVEMDASAPEQYRETLRAICRLGRVLSAPLVNIAAAPTGSDLNAELSRLNGLVRVAQAEGVILTVETHSQTLTCDPVVATELCRKVPGLGLTLDPSHYLMAQIQARSMTSCFPTSAMSGCAIRRPIACRFASGRVNWNTARSLLSCRERITGERCRSTSATRPCPNIPWSQRCAS